MENETPEEVTLQEYNRIQIEYIKVHKWFLSEESGYDIGFNKAAISWVASGLATKFRTQYVIKYE